LKHSRTFSAAQGWYGAFSCGERTANGLIWPVVALVPPPPLASSQVPMRLLPPCQTPARSRFLLVSCADKVNATARSANGRVYRGRIGFTSDSLGWNGHRRSVTAIARACGRTEE